MTGVNTGSSWTAGAHTGMNAGNAEDPEAIRAEIDATRARISRDLDELGQRLNPQYVRGQIKDGIRDATIGRVENMARGAGNGMADTIRANPIPAAVAALGIGWLFLSSKGRNPAQQIGGKAQELGGKAQEVVSRAADTGGEQVHRVEDTFFENPLAIGAAALALGLAVGMTAPRSHAETKLVGGVRDQVVEKVGEVAREATEKVGHVAQRALEETKTAAREEGLAASSSPTGA